MTKDSEDSEEAEDSAVRGPEALRPEWEERIEKDYERRKRN